MHRKTINMLDYSTCATDVQAEGHKLHRDSYIVSLFVLLFLSLYFLSSFPYAFLFHLSNYLFSKKPPSFLIPCSLFFSSFPSSFVFYLLLLFHSFARSTFTYFPLFRGKSFVSSPKLSIPAMLSTQTLVLPVVFRVYLQPPSMKLPTNLNLEPRIRMTGAVPLFSPCAFMTWTGTTLLFLPFTTRANTMPAAFSARS